MCARYLQCKNLLSSGKQLLKEGMSRVVLGEGEAACHVGIWKQSCLSSQ